MREHAHAEHEELILVYEGQGIADIEGEPHPMQPGTTLYLAAQEKHKFTNTGDGPLRFFWVLMPGGLSDFFKAIGRVRHAGDEAPEPFPRPENVAQIEADTVFARTGVGFQCDCMRSNSSRVRRASTQVAKRLYK